MEDQITLNNPQAVEICQWLMEAGRRLDKVEPNFRAMFLVLAPGNRAFSILPQHMMNLLANNLGTVQSVIEARMNYLEQLHERIASAESHLKRVTGETDTSVN